MDAGEAVTAGVVALQPVNRGGAESHEQRLVGEAGQRGRLGERPEAALDQHGAAAAVLQLEGLGGLQATHKAPLC